MRLHSLITLLLCLCLSANAQINVRVKSNGNSKELDVKTSGKPAAGKNTDDKQSPGENKQTPAAKTGNDAAPAAKAPADDTYNGPAKVQLKAFWRQLEKLRSGDASPSALNNAERMLKQVKENDPSYDVTALEKEVAGYRDNANKDAKSKSDATSKAEEEKSYFKNVWMKMVGVYSKGSIIEPGITGKAYLERVEALNLPEYLEKRKAVTDAGPNSYPVLIDEVLADYENYLKRTDRLKWNVTEVMVKSRNEANPQNKMKMLEEARYECEAVLRMSPGNTAFRQKLEEVNKLLGNADSEASKYYTSDFHKQNVGKIVWSNKPLVIGKEKEMTANIKTAFNSGENIFGTIYLGNPVKQLLSGNEIIRVIIKVDNGTAVWGGDLSYLIIPLTVQDKSYLQFALLPDEEWFTKNYASYLAKENWTYSYLMDELANAGDISHNVSCEFDFPTNIQGNIKSSLSLDLGNGTSALKSLSTKLHNQLMASRTLPKAGMSNPALEQQMLAAANGLGWNDKFLKTIITSAAWVTVKNELTGAILYRYLGAVCTTKSNDGKCYYQEFSFKQDYTGGGNYSSAVKFNSYGGKREIGCDKIK
ncbi:MAG: hypothetical protein U0V75_04085 [Ferruginibacter sp.]